MSTALAVYHGCFGRASIYRLDRSLATHAHREGHLLFHIRGGRAGMRIGGSACRIGPLHATAVNPWQAHCFDAAGEEVLVLILYINPTWFLEFMASSPCGLRFGAPSLEVTAPVRRLVDRVASIMLEDTRSSAFDAHLHELTRICFEQTWERDAQSKGRPVEMGVTSAPFGATPADGAFLRDYRVRNSIRLMHERISDAIVIDNIARDAGMSRPHFYKLFRRHVGLTPNIYLNTLRMETAIERLTRTEEAVTNIGLDLGFASQTSFTRFFIANVGIAPTNYRRVVQLAS